MAQAAGRGTQSEWTFLILTCCDPVGDRLSAGSKAASPSLRAVERLDHEAPQIASLSGVYRQNHQVVKFDCYVRSHHGGSDWVSESPPCSHDGAKMLVSLP